jgi:hypothetical protein
MLAPRRRKWCPAVHPKAGFRSGRDRRSSNVTQSPPDDQGEQRETPFGGQPSRPLQPIRRQHLLFLCVFFRIHLASVPICLPSGFPSRALGCLMPQRLWARIRHNRNMARCHLSWSVPSAMVRCEQPCIGMPIMSVTAAPSSSMSRRSPVADGARTIIAEWTSDSLLR